jgi:hypothetical protein
MLKFQDSTTSKSRIAQIKGLLFFLCVMLRVLAPVWDTGNAFWICFGMWGVLDLLGNLLRAIAKATLLLHQLTLQNLSIHFGGRLLVL